MRTMMKCCWKFLVLLPAFVTLASCAHSPYIADNKRRLRHMESSRTRYDVPGQSRVKTGNFNDGY